jgi:hypothetical protein
VLPDEVSEGQRGPAAGRGEGRGVGVQLPQRLRSSNTHQPRAFNATPVAISGRGFPLRTMTKPLSQVPSLARSTSKPVSIAETPPPTALFRSRNSPTSWDDPVTARIRFPHIRRQVPALALPVPDPCCQMATTRISLSSPEKSSALRLYRSRRLACAVAAINKSANLLRGFRPSCTTAATTSP